ncbi:putative formin-like protein 21a [Triticum dicoccoides]|uniref:putative formin-like protein 21a n=1 Tax=Triticum dicoccoides TaxID=85692 RepID=UPI00188FA5FB|nr:putative formin-like protein 21a [Triticum dicoccoides]
MTPPPAPPPRTRLREPTPQPPSPPPIPSPSPPPVPGRHRRSLCCRRGPGGAATTFIADLQVAVGTPRQRFATAAVEFQEGHDPREIFVGVAAAADVACRRSHLQVCFTCLGWNFGSWRKVA